MAEEVLERRIIGIWKLIHPFVQPYVSQSVVFDLCIHIRESISAKYGTTTIIRTSRFDETLVQAEGQ